MEAANGIETVVCALCGSSASIPFCVKFGQSIVECRDCGLVFVNPRLPPAETAKRYSESYFWSEYLPAVRPPETANLSRLLAHRYGAAFELLRDDTTAERRLLELGIGAGYFLKASTFAKWRGYGVEYAIEASRYAHDVLGLDVVRGSADHLPFRSEQFEAAAMWDVIEHLHEPLEALREVRRCLKPGGRLLVSTPNLRALSRLVLGEQWAVLSPAEHLFYFTEGTLRLLLLKAGFSSVRFVKLYRPWRRRETMNAAYTHAPASPRTRLYSLFVETVGLGIYRAIQAFGRADAILAVATRGC
jgi:SAM-dependent methyltransferase